MNSLLMSFLCVVLVGLVSYVAAERKVLVEISRDDLPLVDSILDLQREDLESVSRTRVIVWCTTSRLEQLQAAVSFRLVENTTLKNCLKFRQHNTTYSRAEPPNWDEYHGPDFFADMAAHLVDNKCAAKHSIGQSVNGVDIIALTMTAQNPTVHPPPHVLMAGGIHGDEPVGGQLLLRWMWETCFNPSTEQARVNDQLTISYLPFMNPDGYNLCQRSNANGVDLNRNFPQPPNGDVGPHPLQVESNAFICFLEKNNFTHSTMFHGGARVVNFAYDDCYQGVPRPPGSCPPASTADAPRGHLVLSSSEAYSKTLVKHESCDVGKECLTNGASWYKINGGSQDFAFYFLEQIDMTMEISTDKWPLADTLDGFWGRNKDAMFEFMMWPVRGSGTERLYRPRNRFHSFCQN